MQITNNHNLPKAIYNAIVNKEYSKGEAQYSATELLQPVQLRALMRLNYAHISVDAADSIWSLWGSAVHHILEQSKAPEVIAEQRWYLKVAGFTIGGMPDVYDGIQRTIEDYKTTSVYKVMKNDIEDWFLQLNIYKLLLEEAGKPVELLKIHAILKDWSHKKAREDKEFAEKSGQALTYPQAPIVTIDIPYQRSLDTLLYIIERIKLHEEAKHLKPHELPYCTPKERWCGEDIYAIYSAEKNYTYRVFEIEKGKEEEASQKAYEVFYKMKATGYEIIRREGESLRCKYFCPVAQFCNQFQEQKPKVILPDETQELTFLPNTEVKNGEK